MKSFSRFLLEKDNKTSSIKGSSDSYTQPNLFDTSKIGKEEPVKDVKTTKDIIGNRKQSKLKGRPPGSKNKVVNPNASTQLSTSDSQTVKQGLGKADPSNNLKGQSSDIETKKENTVKNNTNKNKIKVNKKISGDGKIVIRPRRGDIKLEKEIIRQQTPGTNTTITPSKSGSVLKTRANRVTTNVTNTRDVLQSIEKGSQKNISKPPVTTNVTDTKKFKGFLDRMYKATGVESPITKKLSPNTNVTGSSVNATKKLITKARVGGLLKGVGRFAGGAFAAKDAYDKARIEKAKGRSRTSQILGGIARGAGGYLGGALGATLGTVAGGGVGSAVLGTGGAIAGYNIGTKVGDFLYDKGRKLATGKYKFPAKTFKNLRNDINTNVNKMNLRNLGRTTNKK